MASTKKRNRPGGNVGSSPNSSSTSNLTCVFGGLSSMGVSSHCTLLLDVWDFSCQWRWSMERLSHSSAGQDHGGLGEGAWCWLGSGGKGLWCCLNLVIPLEWVCLLLEPDHPAEGSSLSHLVDSVPKAWLQRSGLWYRMAVGASLASCRGPGWPSFTL